MRLAALTAARTVSLELSGLRLPEDAVALRMPYERWAPGDRARTLNAGPAVFGVARAVLDLLDEEPAAALRLRLDDVRRRACAPADHPVPLERAGERPAVRAEAYDLLIGATRAAVVAGGGRSMDRSHRTQRLAREALFLLVQGQTAETRTAHPRALAAG